MKKLILLFAFMTISLQICKSQTNLLYGFTDTFNVTTVKGMIDARFRDTLYNNINNPTGGRKIYLQFRRVFGKAYSDSLFTGNTEGLNEDIVKFQKLIFSGDAIKKIELVYRLKAEYAPVWINLINQVCIGYAYNGGKMNGHIVVGLATDRNTTNGTCHLKDIKNYYSYDVDLMSISIASEADKRLYGYY